MPTGHVVVGVLGAVGLLRHRPIAVPVTAAVLALPTALQEAGVPVLVDDRLLRLVVVFLLGAAAHLHAHRIPMRADISYGSTSTTGRCCDCSSSPGSAPRPPGRS